MSHLNDSHRRTLAHNADCGVDLCSCGTVHLTVGAVTVRLGPDSYEALCETLVQGLIALKVKATDFQKHRPIA